MAAAPALARRALTNTARSLVVDVVTAEVVGAFRRAGIHCLLLKGPSLARWLYPDGAVRAYVDTDLLVAPGSIHAAERVLRGLGFTARLEPCDTPGWQRPSREWLRATDGANVDLHRSLAGLGVDGSELWRAVLRDADRIWVGGEEVETLGVYARTLHLALHAAQHGPRAPVALEDLRRALAVLDDETWTAAAGLATALQARGSLAAGLRLLPDGAALAVRLQLPEPSLEAALLASGPPSAAMALVQFGTVPSAGGRIRFILRKLVPTPRYLRVWSPLARHGLVGLLLAYVWRPLWLVRQAPAGLRAWQGARRAVAGRKAARR